MNRIRKNDSAITGVGGSLTLLKGEHPSVQMVREKVAMVLEPKSYQVTVDFVFTNSGPATKVLMGFPESGSGDVQQTSKSQMLAFTTWIDGATTSVAWKPVKSSEEGLYQAHWVKEVSFAANQTRKIRVRYRSPYGSSAIGGINHFVSYNFTGANWKGKVEESALAITFQRPGTFVAAGQIEPLGGESGAVAFVQSGPTLSRVWKNWEAQADFTLAFGTAPAGWRTVTEPGMTGEESTVPGAVILPSVKLRTVQVASPAPKLLDWCPPAFDQGAEVLVVVGYLASLTGEKWELSPTDPTTAVTLTTLGHTFVFTVGKSTAQIDGKTIPLPVAPQVLRGAFGEMDFFYVPFSVIAKHLGLKFEALKSNRTLRVIQ